MRLAVLAWLALAVGCADRPLPLPERARDLGAGHELDLATPDLAAPDLAARDLAAPDLVAAPDLAPPAVRFAPPSPLPNVGVGFPLLARDLDGDGADDLVLVQGQGADVAVCWGDRATPLDGCTVVYAQSFAGVAVGDVDGDGRPDVVVTGVGQVHVLRGLGGRQLSAPRDVPLGSGVTAQAVAVGNLNGDAALDVVAGVTGVGLSGYAVLLGDPAGPGALQLTDVGHLVAPLLGDLDHDGHLDLLDCLGLVSARCTFRRGDGTGQLAADGSFELEGGESPQLADLDGDGVVDLVLAHPTGLSLPSAGTITPWHGNGDGTFRSLGDLPVGASPWWLAPADFDRDGRLDLAVGNAAEGPQSDATPLRILVGAGGGGFLPPLALATGHDNVWGLVAGDFDGDGRADLVAGSATATGAFGALTWIRNTSP